MPSATSWPAARRLLGLALALAVVAGLLVCLQAPRADAAVRAAAVRNAVAALAAVAAPAAGCAPNCVPVENITLVQPDGVDAAVAPTPEQYSALSALERIAIRNVETRRGLADTPEEAIRLRYSSRAALRIELFAILLQAAGKPAASRTADERTALGWLAAVQQRKNVAVADAALEEYRKFYGNTAFQGGQYPQNACTYTPPAPFSSEYPVGPRWSGCFGFVPPLDFGPTIPTQDDFTRWGVGATETGGASSGSGALAAQAAYVGYGLLGASAAVGPAVGALFALPAATATAMYTWVVPYAFIDAIFVLNTNILAAKAAGATFATATAAATSPTAAVEAAAASNAAAGIWNVTAGGAGISVGAVLGAAAVVLVALTLIITAIIKVVSDAAVGQKLLDAAASARTTPVDGASLLTTAGGQQAAMYAIQRVSATTDLASIAAPPPAPSTATGGDILQISDPSDATPPVRTQELSFVTPQSDGTYGSLTRSFVGGWWVDRSPDASVWQELMEYQAVTLWDPNPRNQNGVLTDRPGFGYDAMVSTVVVNGDRKWVATAIDRPGYPLRGTDCNDYDADGCWLTEQLPYLEPTRSARRLAAHIPNDGAGAFTVAGAPAAAPVQGDTVTLRAERAGQPLTTDLDGDAVTVTWATTQCPAAGCLSPRTGATQSFTFTQPGAYTIVATATDVFGAATSRTTSFTVANSAPRVTLDATAISGTRAAPITISGRAVDGAFTPVSVTIVWGDGSAPTTVPGGSFPFTASHTYPSLGGYVATVTASDGTLTSVPQTVVVTIGNAAPTVTLNASTRLPASWAGLQPGTRISVSGTVTDADPTQPVTVRARWYDGTVDDVVVPRANGAVSQAFTVQHVVRATTASVLIGGETVSLVDVTAVDSSGATSDVAQQAGDVVDLPPVLRSVNVVPGGPGVPSTITGFVTDPNGAAFPILGVLWNDGTDNPNLFFGEQFPPAANGAFTATHTYATAGRYTATLIASDTGVLGRTIRQDVVVSVLAAAPAITSATWSNTPVQGEPAQLTVQITAPAAGSVKVVWGPPFLEGFGDTLSFPAGTSTLVFSHAYTLSGAKEVTATTQIPGLADTTVDLVIDVLNFVPTVTTPEPLTAAEGDAVSLPVRWADLGLDFDDVVVDWGDGTARATFDDQVARALDLTHTYVEPGVYPVTIQITDTAGGSVTTSTTATITNVAPELGAVTVTAAPEGSATTVSAPVTETAGGPTRLRVDWGDGTTSIGEPGTSAADRTASHAYAENGTYTVSVVALDSVNAESAARTAPVIVANARPAVAVSAPASVTEGSTVEVSFTVADPGSADTGTATVDWGDGTTTTGLVWTADTRTVTASHLYGDDDPTGTATDRKTVRVVARDDDRASSVAARAIVTVRNVAPTVTAVLRDAAGRELAAGAKVPAGSSVALTIGVADPGADTHTLSIVWGDGTRTSATALSGPDTVTHTYPRTGTFSVQAKVVDDDGASALSVKQATKVVTPAASASSSAAALRALAAGGVPTAVARPLRTAALLLVGPAPGGGPDALDEIAAGDTGGAVDLLGEATAQIDVATLAGGPASAQQRAVDVALVARALVLAAIAAGDPASQLVADATAQLATADRALAADPAGAVAGYGAALTVLTPPAQP